MKDGERGRWGQIIKQSRKSYLFNQKLGLMGIATLEGSEILLKTQNS
jgi:hypothetical protein